MNILDTKDIKRMLCKSKQILYSDGPLEGTVPKCYVMGIDNISGTIYIRDGNGEWTVAPNSGAFTGWDDMLAQNQQQTQSGTINVDNNELVFQNIQSFIVQNTSGQDTFRVEADGSIFSNTNDGYTKFIQNGRWFITIFL